MAPTVLAIDDEPDVLELLEYNLVRDGFTVIKAVDGTTGLELARRKKPDVILLDVMLPGMDGVEVCRALKARDDTAAIPILMVSARGEETDVVLGLGVGAEDYVAKPFRPRELTARIRAALRRVRQQGAPAMGAVLRVGPIVVDGPRYEARVGDEKLTLTLTEFGVLLVLASHPGRVFTREQILGRVAGVGSDLDERNVDSHVSGLRRKLGAAAGMIETIRGVGYRLSDEGD